MGQIQTKPSSETENLLSDSEPPDTKPPKKNKVSLGAIKIHEFRAGAHFLNTITCVH